MVETKAVSDRCRALNFRSWLMKTSLMNAFALVSLQRIQEFHLWPLNTSTPKPSLFNPQRSPSGTPRDDRTKTDRQTHNTHTKRAHTTKKRISCRVCFFACLWRVLVGWPTLRKMPLGCFFFCCGLCLFDLLIYLPASKFLFQTNKLKDCKREVESPIPHPTPATPNVLHDTGRRGRGRARASAKSTTFLGQKTLARCACATTTPGEGTWRTETGWLVWLREEQQAPPGPPVRLSQHPAKTQILLGFVCPQGASGGFDGGWDQGVVCFLLLICYSMLMYTQRRRLL